MVSVRLPRFKRSAKIAPFRLTDRDREILTYVHRHRFLRSDHLKALLPGSPQQILRRLQLLYHHGFLERPLSQLDHYQAGSRRMAYGIGNKGAALLKHELALPFHRLQWGQMNRVGRIFLDHALLVSDVMVAFEVACRRRNQVRLLAPDEANLPTATARKREPFQWTAEIAKGVVCGVIPDRVFGLEASDASGRKNRCWYFLEADCGTMPVTRRNMDQSSFCRKLLAYEATWRKNLHRTRLGFDRFRVLTVTRSPERVEHLLEACSQLQRGQGLFLFTDASSLLAGDDVLTKVWRTAHERPETLI